MNVPSTAAGPAGPQDRVSKVLIWVLLFVTIACSIGMIAATRDAFAGRLDVRLGLESDFYPGVEPWLEKLHARVPLSHVLGSIHYQIADYRKLFYTGDLFSYQKLYFEHLALSAESGLFDTLAHPV